MAIGEWEPTYIHWGLFWFVLTAASLERPAAVYHTQSNFHCSTFESIPKDVECRWLYAFNVLSGKFSHNSRRHVYGLWEATTLYSFQGIFLCPTYISYLLTIERLVLVT